MPLQDFFQPGFVQVGLLEQLFDARLVLRPSHAGGNGNDVLGAEDFGRDALVFNTLGLAHSFPGQPYLNDGETTPALHARASDLLCLPRKRLSNPHS